MAFLAQHEGMTSRLNCEFVYLTGEHLKGEIIRAYGKTWWRSDNYAIARIGAGAYGDAHVWGNVSI